jgi:hypothetical protein
MCLRIYQLYINLYESIVLAKMKKAGRKEANKAKKRLR